MQFFDDSSMPWEAADASNFTGQARIKRSGVFEGEDSVRQYRVEFQPDARTYWHSHTGPQLLVIVSGVCHVQRWEDILVRVPAGQSVLIGPGEKHWHGAGPEGGMVHLAININADTTWLEEAEVV